MCIVIENVLCLFRHFNILVYFLLIVRGTISSGLYAALGMFRNFSARVQYMVETSWNQRWILISFLLPLALIYFIPYEVCEYLWYNYFIVKAGVA